MPYQVKKQGDKYVIINKETGKVVGHSDTKAKAEASVRARLGGEHGWKPTGKKRGK